MESKKEAGARAGNSRQASSSKQILYLSALLMRPFSIDASPFY